MIVRKFGWFIFAFFSLGIGLYPLLYFLVDMTSNGLLASKSSEVMESSIWNWSFYQHISFGGVSLFIGWIQFSKKIRGKYLNFHRTLGKIYVITALLSGMAGLYIAFFATGGLVAVFGFGFMAIFWLTTTSMAYISIRKREINQHRNWMIRSYALCWAAVTLRLWLPTFQFGFGMDFIPAYLIISWLCWMPNLMVAELIIRLKPLSAIN